MIDHKGSILGLQCAPNRMVMATSATDSTVKIWQITPNAKEKTPKVKVILGARTEGNTLSIAWSKDGKYLAAGVSYKNSPEGMIMVWDMQGDKEGTVEYLFRSRPSVRFGKPHSITWGNKGRFIYTGDTTGNIWAWDTENMLQLACITSHQDIVYDLHVAKNTLFSVSHDQSLSAFDLSPVLKIPIKKSKIHIQKFVFIFIFVFLKPNLTKYIYTHTHTHTHTRA